MVLWCKVLGLRFGVQGSNSRVESFSITRPHSGTGFEVWVLMFRAWGLGFRFWGSRFQVPFSGFLFPVKGFGFLVTCDEVLKQSVHLKKCINQMVLENQATPKNPQLIV